MQTDFTLGCLYFGTQSDVTTFRGFSRYSFSPVPTPPVVIDGRSSSQFPRRLGGASDRTGGSLRSPIHGSTGGYSVTRVPRVSTKKSGPVIVLLRQRPEGSTGESSLTVRHRDGVRRSVAGTRGLFPDRSARRGVLPGCRAAGSGGVEAATTPRQRHGRSRRARMRPRMSADGLVRRTPGAGTPRIGGASNQPVARSARSCRSASIQFSPSRPSGRPWASHSSYARAAISS